jgi:hypothetical protein
VLALMHGLRRVFNPDVLMHPSKALPDPLL